MSGEIRIIRDAGSLTREGLLAITRNQYGNLVKAVIDVEGGLVAIGGDLHSDEEALLLEQGSKQENLWGINLYPEKTGDEFIEFDSMINLRPRQGNRSRSIEDPSIQQKIREVVSRLMD